MVKIKEKKKKKKSVVKIFSGSVFPSIVHAASADHLTASSKNERNKKGAHNCVLFFRYFESKQSPSTPNL